ncbi:MAG: hypothetical protein HY781_03395 [Chloroflexi bacterium]|nr:hypothetical protein [Chloroflexota bacterium]
MRIIDKASVPAIVLAGLLVYLAERYQLPILIPAALALLGLFAIWLGGDTFVRGEIRMYDRFYVRREFYSGLPARLLATIMLLPLVKTWPGLGIFLAAIGFFTLLFGLIRLITGSAWQQHERRPLDEAGFRLRGLFGLIAGILLIVLGLWLIF